MRLHLSHIFLGESGSCNVCMSTRSSQELFLAKRGLDSVGKSNSWLWFRVGVCR